MRRIRMAIRTMEASVPASADTGMLPASGPVTDTIAVRRPPPRRRIRAGLLAAAVVLAAMMPFLASAPASASNTSPCTPGYLSYCVAPSNVTLSTSPPYCTPFPDGREWQNYTDANGVSQLWTYSNGSHACIQVNYAPVYDNSHACYYYFYVPYNGYANAPVTFGWWDSSGKKHYANVVNEATSPPSGWVELYMNGTNVFDPAQAIGVTKIQFQDNNGANPGSSYIGWGVATGYGIEQFC